MVNKYNIEMKNKKGGKNQRDFPPNCPNDINYEKKTIWALIYLSG